MAGNFLHLNVAWSELIYLPFFLLLFSRNVEPLLEFITWNHWKSRHLSYFLDKRTVRLVSGASLIFSAPKVQWIQVFQGLNISAKSGDNDICETIVSWLIS